MAGQITKKPISLGAITTVGDLRRALEPLTDECELHPSFDASLTIDVMDGSYLTLLPKPAPPRAA